MQLFTPQLFPTLSSNKLQTKHHKSNGLIKDDTQEEWEWPTLKFICMLIYSFKWFLPITSRRFPHELALSYSLKKVQYYWTQCQNMYILVAMNLPSRFSAEIDELCSEWKQPSNTEQLDNRNK